MKLLNVAKEAFSEFVQTIGSEWWVEVTTAQPRCTYYFGPFDSDGEAEAAYPGYVQDLEAEGAQEIMVAVKRCKPKTVTVAEDAEVF